MSGFFTSDSYYTGPEMSDDLVRDAERRLGLVLPASYVRLLYERNGGVPVRCCCPAAAPTSWAEDHIKIEALRGLGGEWGIDSEGGLGSVDMIREWGYPDVGVVICHMPSGGHDAVMLDYSGCGRDGEPSVIYVDDARRVQTLARSFAEFVAALFVCPEYLP